MPLIRNVYTGTSTGTVATATATVDAQAGDVLVAMGCCNGADTTPAETQTLAGGGLTWTKAIESNVQTGNRAGAATIFFAYAKATITSQVITLTRSDSLHGSGMSLVVSVLSHADPVLWSAANNDGDGTLPSLNIAPTRPGSYIFACNVDWNQAGLGSPGTGQTELFEHNIAGEYTTHFWRTTDPIPDTATTTMNYTTPNQAWNMVALQVLDAQDGATRQAQTMHTAGIQRHGGPPVLASQVFPDGVTSPPYDFDALFAAIGDTPGRWTAWYETDEDDDLDYDYQYGFATSLDTSYATLGAPAEPVETFAAQPIFDDWDWPAEDATDANDTAMDVTGYLLSCSGGWGCDWGDDWGSEIVADINSQHPYLQPDPAEEWFDQPLDDVTALFLAPPAEPVETFAAQPHFGELPIEAEDTADYANDAALDTAYVNDGPLAGGMEAAAQPHFGELPIPPDETEDYANDTTVDALPAFAPPEAVVPELLAAQADQQLPVFPEDEPGQIAADDYLQFAAPTEPDETHAAQPHYGNEWWPEAETEDYTTYDDTTAQQVGPAAADEVHAAQPHFGEWVWDADQTGTEADTDPSTDISAYISSIFQEAVEAFAAQPHFGDIEIPETLTDDYAADSTVDTSYLNDGPAASDTIAAAQTGLSDADYTVDDHVDSVGDDLAWFAGITPVTPDEVLASQPIADLWAWEQELQPEQALDEGWLIGILAPPAGAEFFTDIVRGGEWIDEAEPFPVDPAPLAPLDAAYIAIANPPVAPAQTYKIYLLGRYTPTLAFLGQRTTLSPFGQWNPALALSGLYAPQRAATGQSVPAVALTGKVQDITGVPSGFDDGFDTGY